MARPCPLCDDECTMTSSAPTTATSSGVPPLAPAPPKAYRSSEDGLLGGVAAGLAEHLGVPVVAMRAAFMLSAVIGGFGVAAYAGFWLVLPSERHLEVSTPGLEAATRQGKRPRRVRRRLQDLGVLVAAGAVVIGVVTLAQDLLGRSLVIWPVLIGLVGLAVLWRQADEAQRERWLDSSGRVSFVRAVVGNGGWASYARLVAGAGLLLAALVLFAVQSGGLGVAREAVVAGALGVGGLALTIGPWLLRLTTDLSEERAARVRSQERADMAAHLHDSVLQTLALIQKHSGDARTVATLARAQERDLRSWLYAEQPPVDTSVASALRAVAAEVEDAHGVPVEVVVVGDAPVSDPVRALVLAAREALVNAARHSGAERVDLYAECTGSAVEVFVRDRGRGFDESTVPDDRHGVRDSIRDRMRRHGGSATIRTSSDGTEVRLSTTVARDDARAGAATVPSEEPR
jgi:signal transduction histidine kinase/phage shock protein PspC (stress-responsive transcriptional regulator)